MSLRCLRLVCMLGGVAYGAISTCSVALLAAKVAVVLLSNSMSLIASTVDSLMDLLSTIIIYGTSRVIERRTWQSEYDFPTGKRRMEPMSVLIFSVISEFIISCQSRSSHLSADSRLTHFICLLLHAQ